MWIVLSINNSRYQHWQVSVWIWSIELSISYVSLKSENITYVEMSYVLAIPEGHENWWPEVAIFASYHDSYWHTLYHNISFGEWGRERMRLRKLMAKIMTAWGAPLPKEKQTSKASLLAWSSGFEIWIREQK